MRPRALCAAIVLALGSMLALAACGGSNKPTPTPTPSAQSILDAAAQRFGQVNSAHFKLQIAGNVYLDEARTLTLRGAEGDIARPDRASAKAQVAVASQNLNISMIAIGSDQYITNFLTGSWMRAPSGLSYNPAILFDEQQGIPNILRKTEDVALVGDEEVDGVKAHHLRGTVARETVRPVTGGAFNSDRLAFDVWVAKDTNDIVKVVLREPEGTPGTTGATWTLSISKQNQPVTIEAPSL